MKSCYMQVLTLFCLFFESQLIHNEIISFFAVGVMFLFRQDCDLVVILIVVSHDW